MSLQRLNWRLQYWAVRLLAAGLGTLSWESVQRLGETLGLVASRFVPRRRRLVLENLRRAFPEASDERLSGVAAEVWKNLGRVGAEFLKSASMEKDELLAVCSVENGDILRRHLKPGQGALLHTGHFGNWELAGQAMNASGIPTAAVARRIKNPDLDRWVNAVRSRPGVQVISHKQPFFPVVKALKQGRMIALMMDQSLPEGGVFVPFFGRPAATTTFTALLSMKLKCPVFPVRVTRRGRRIVVSIQEPIERPAGAREEEFAALLTGLFEGWIREKPEEWFWVHNRWKRAPEAPVGVHG